MKKAWNELLTFRGVSEVFLLLVASGCAPPSGEIGQVSDPSSRFLALEDRLVEAETVLVGFKVTAEGAVSADLEGRLRVSTEGATELTAAGVFAGEEVDLLLRTDGDTYEYGAGSERRKAPTPEFLQEGIVIGFTRMGILHNLAMLMGNAPPDGVDGAVRDWVVVDSFSYLSTYGGVGSAASPHEAEDAVSFSMIVGGEPAGSASLVFDPNGYPSVRHQVVHFPTGEMRVVEEYFDVTIVP